MSYARAGVLRLFAAGLALATAATANASSLKATTPLLLGALVVPLLFYVGLIRTFAVSFIGGGAIMASIVWAWLYTSSADNRDQAAFAPLTMILLVIASVFVCAIVDRIVEPKRRLR